MSSCSVSSYFVSNYLGEDEFLVKSNKIIIEDPQNSKGSVDLIYNLESLIEQKPNTNYLLTPRELIYFRNQEEFESNEQKKGRLKEAQRPVLHSDDAMFRTAERMEKYLRFSKGYYNAKVFPKVFLSEKRAEVVYSVYTEPQYTVRKKEYFTEDEAVLAIILNQEPNSILKPGTAIDESIFDAEKTRIFELLQDQGYANFAKNHIDFKADSSSLQMDLFISILPPAQGDFHRKFTIGEIHVYPDYRGSIDDNSPFAINYNQIDYAFTSEKYYIKPSTLDRSIEIKERSRYKKKLIDNTYTSLANLGTYRFINISSSVSSVYDTVVNYNIFLTPIEDTWAIDASLNMFYTYLANNNQPLSLIGLSGITSLSNINIFGGGEKFSISAESTGEISVPLQNSNLTFKTGVNLTYPILFDYKGINRRFLTSFLSDDNYLRFKNKTKTDIGLSYSFVQQFNQYITHNINGSVSFEYKPNQKFTYVFTPFSINSLSTNVDSVFRAEFLDPSPLFSRSFDKRFITNIFIPQFVYQMQSPIFENGFSWGIKVNTEISGAEITAANLLFNTITNSTDLWAINLGNGNVFEFSRYGLVDIDAKSKWNLGSKQALAGRMRAGVALPFFDNDVIPFIRQFFVGGANSLRAWQTRQLGPGAHFDPGLDSIAFFQSGEIVLEANLEYRFPIWWLFEGATFIDAGNVWTLKEDISRPGSQFQFNEFYKQIAIGYGFGVRLNLNFVIIRLDMGYKLRYPYLADDPNERAGYWEIPEFTLTGIGSHLLRPNFTIGLNYPF